MVEVVIALGIVSVGVVAVLGLFPLALGIARDSREEPRATFAARKLLADLEAGDGPGRSIHAGSGTSATAWPVALDSAGFATFACDGEGLFLRWSASNALASPPSSASLLADVRVDPSTGIPGLSRVEVLVRAPAAAPPNRQRRYVFVAMLRHGFPLE